MTKQDRFYVSQKLYDEMASRNPDDVKDLIVSDKVEDYDVWPEHLYKFHAELHDLWGDMLTRIQPLLDKWPILKSKGGSK